MMDLIRVAKDVDGRRVLYSKGIPEELGTGIGTSEKVSNFKVFGVDFSIYHTHNGYYNFSKDTLDITIEADNKRIFEIKVLRGCFLDKIHDKFLHETPDPLPFFQYLISHLSTDDFDHLFTLWK